jgi:hypothetical protein
MRACPNGHPIDDDRARTCPTCGSLPVPLEATAARTDASGTAGGSGRESATATDPASTPRERISAPVLGLVLAAVAIAIGLFAAWMALQQPRPGPSPSPSAAPQTYDGGARATAGRARVERQPDGGPSSPEVETSSTMPSSLTE